MRTEPDRKTEHRSETRVQEWSDCCAVGWTGMRSNCAVLDFLAPPFVSRQKVESNNKKEKIECKEIFDSLYNTTSPMQETRRREH